MQHTPAAHEPACNAPNRITNNFNRVSITLLAMFLPLTANLKNPAIFGAQLAALQFSIGYRTAHIAFPAGGYTEPCPGDPRVYDTPGRCC